MKIGDKVDGHQIVMKYGGVPVLSVPSNELKIGDKIFISGNFWTIAKIRRPSATRMVLTFSDRPGMPRLRINRKTRDGRGAMPYRVIR